MSTAIKINRIISIIIVLVLILSNFSCKLFCDENESHQKKSFNTADLSKLSLNDIDNFWDNDSIKRVLDFPESAIFNTHPAYLGGIRYEGENKAISVTVFNSQVTSLEAMELRRNNVAAIINEGQKHDLLNGKWWFGDGISSTIFVNQWNTIIETVYFHSDYEQVKTVLINTAAEIAQRIDSLSK